LKLQRGVTQSGTSQENDREDEWQDQNVDWEECECGSTYKLVIRDTVLQLDDVESPVSIQVLEDLLVPVDEHGSKK